MSYDYLVVGAGFAGATMARCLADAGKRVLVIDKRDHIGGNAFDYVNEHGVRIHKYGPHIFHTNAQPVVDFLSRFTEWRPYEHRVLASVGGKLVPFPVNLTTLEMLGLTREDCAPDETITHPKNAEEQCLQRVGRKLYELFFEGYTTKMWGRHPRDLDASVTARIPVRWDSRDDRYFTDSFQAMPRDGYTAMFERMLEGIEVRLGEPFAWSRPKGCGLVWTGPIDQYFNNCHGPLPYRSMRFDQHVDWRFASDRCATVNIPDASVPFTRGTDMGVLSGTGRGAIVSETPQAEGEPFYPIPAPENAARYRLYEQMMPERDTTFIGRLARYRYLNMDQCVGQALATFRRLGL